MPRTNASSFLIDSATRPPDYTLHITAEALVDALDEVERQAILGEQRRLLSLARHYDANSYANSSADLTLLIQEWFDG